MIKRPYQNMSFSGQAGHRKPAGEFGDRKPWDRAGSGSGAGGERRDFRGGSSYGGPRRSFGGGGGSRGSFGGGSFGGERPMFDAQCNKCGNDCKVPFRPTGQKPVYCSNCFVKPDMSAPRNGSSNFGGGSSFGGSSAPAGASFDMKKINEQLKTLNTKLDLIIEAIGINDDDEEGDMEEGDEEAEGEGTDEDEEEIEVLHLDGEPPPKK